MKAVKRLWTCLLAYSLTLNLSPMRALAQQGPVTPKSAPAPVIERDLQHDFDWEFGTWKLRVQRLQHPLTGSNTWIELNGTVQVRKVWDGRGNLAEIEVDGPTGHL